MKPLEVIKIPRLKLAGTYLLIIMFMSTIFSLAIYNISERELKNQRQLKIPRNLPIELADEFNLLRDLRYKEAKDNLKERLIVFNLLVLISGALLSYILASRALRPIEEALEAQNRFTSDASHEIKTPLTIMKSEIEVALRDKKLKINDAKEVLDSNLEEIKKLEALTNALLQLARQENIDESKTCIKISSVIENAIDQVSNIAKSKKIKVTKSVKDFEVFAEKQTLTQAIVISLDNAIKFSPEKSVIKISTKINRGFNQIEIKDKGSGIDNEDLPFIFDRFYRADKSRTNQETNGYGLGLPLAKQIIESHRGEISIASIKNKGTKLTISLPKN